MVSITSNLNWSVSGIPDWLTANISNGTNDGTVQFTTQINATTSIRTAIITLQAVNNLLIRSITIIQVGTATNTTGSGANFFIEVNPDTINFEASAGIEMVTITSNVSWTVRNDVYWILANISLRNINNNVNNSVEVVANSTSSPRSTLLTVSGNGVSKTILVNQAAAPSTTGIYYQHSNISNPLIISPNPVSFNGEIMFNKRIDLKLYDLIGNELRSAHGVTELNLKGLHAGVYFIRTTENEVRKLVVQ